MAATPPPPSSRLATAGRPWTQLPCRGGETSSRLHFLSQSKKDGKPETRGAAGIRRKLGRQTASARFPSHYAPQAGASAAARHALGLQRPRLQNRRNVCWSWAGAKPGDPKESQTGFAKSEAPRQSPSASTGPVLLWPGLSWFFRGARTLSPKNSPKQLWESPAESEVPTRLPGAASVDWPLSREPDPAPELGSQGLAEPHPQPGAVTDGAGRPAPCAFYFGPELRD